MIFLNKIIIECLCDRLSYQSVKEKILNYFHLVCKMFNTSTIYRKVTIIFNENVNLLLDNSGKLNSGGARNPLLMIGIPNVASLR